MADDGLSRDHTTKKIALVAHDNMKSDLLDWARLNRPLLLQHELYATGTTGTLLEQDLTVRVHKLQNGPLGGDQQGSCARHPCALFKSLPPRAGATDATRREDGPMVESTTAWLGAGNNTHELIL